MMDARECSEAWRKVVSIYNDTIEYNSPRKTVEAIVGALGLDKSIEVFATISQIKKHDGRIYGANRKAMEGITINPDCLVWDRSNPMLGAGLDSIHTTHINQLITELLKMKRG